MKGKPTATVMATVADTMCTPEFIERLHSAGMTGVRINSAHASPEAIEAMVGVIRSVDPSISILMDTKGAEIRTTATLDYEEIALAEGDEMRITEHATAVTTGSVIAITASGICDKVVAGTHILLDDGEVELEATGNDGNELTCQVVKAGRLGARKTVSFQGVESPEALPALTERDRAAIRAGIRAGIDIVAHSFVRSAADVEAVREELAGTDIKLFSKIECRRAIENFDEILSASDGLLCARGDLGAEVGIMYVPAVEMHTIAECRAASKPVIVATQFLQSMMDSPVPTRAEAADIAWAVMQGADTLLLCGETARGKYPEECVKWMKSVIDTTALYREGGWQSVVATFDR
ncbi:MAG: pyruvate kinase [Paramuribaculum sp.]|nr:pyruvate kinase [Paramuribaculum sp.]